MEILDPVGGSSVQWRRLAPRPAGLDGAVIGLLDNSKPNARVLLESVARPLLERLDAREIRVWQKPGAAAGAVAAVLDQIAAECAVVLTASAD